MSAVASLPNLPKAAADVVVTKVTTKADREAFIRSQWKFYEKSPAWIPPLLMERRVFLDPKKNPFFLHADVDLFLARRGGEIVGRIAAVEDKNYNKFQGTKCAYWGMFECVDDAGVATALFDQVRTFARGRGLNSMLGPMNLSTNYDCGLLIDAFDLPPCFLMTYNPAYYVGLVEGQGFKKAKDLLAWKTDVTAPVDERITRIADKIRKKENVTIRPVRMAELATEIDRIKRIYNDAWEKNWGFVPMTDAEFDHMAKDMKDLVIPELLLIAEVQGEPAGFAMTLPDVNRTFAKMNGKLFPTGVFKFLWDKRGTWKTAVAARLVTLGTRKAFRKRGLEIVLYHDTHINAQKRGIREGEISWTLEDNDLINTPIQRMGGKLYKTYRLYEAPV